MTTQTQTDIKLSMALETQNAANNKKGIIGVHSLTNKQQIFSILSSVQKSRTPITIKFEGSEKYYTSIILKTDLDKNHLIIDEIAPEDGHVLALQNMSFSIRGSHGGISLFFRHNIISGSNSENGIAFYSIPLPDKMVYQQRRNSFRALVPRALNTQASVTSDKHLQPLSGRLYDISITGCRINFEGEVNQGLVRGDIFELAAITLPDGDQLNYALKLKHAFYRRENDETSCGFEFLGIDKVGQRLVDRFVYFLQREARRLETK